MNIYHLLNVYIPCQPLLHTEMLLVSRARLNVIRSGHTMPFKEALNVASLNLHVRALLPKWMIALRSSWRHANVAFDELYVSRPLTKIYLHLTPEM